MNLWDRLWADGKLRWTSNLSKSALIHFFRASRCLSRVLNVNGATYRLSCCNSFNNRSPGLATFPMFFHHVHKLMTVLGTVICITCCSGIAQAGWLTIKNDTNLTIVVQESVVVNGQVKRGKPTSLLPGETLREFLPAPTVKKIEVFQGQNPNQAVWSGDLNCKDEKQTFSVSATEGKVSVDKVNCPTKK
jgi:hypothetical protein